MWGRGTEKVRAVEEGFGEGEVGDNEDMRAGFMTIKWIYSVIYFLVVLFHWGAGGA
jgi:hypothetical protein